MKFAFTNETHFERIEKRTNGLIHALHAEVFIQLRACVFRAWHTGYLKFLFELGDIAHAFLELKRSKGGEGEANNDDGAREGI